MGTSIFQLPRNVLPRKRTPTALYQASRQSAFASNYWKTRKKLSAAPITASRARPEAATSLVSVVGFTPEIFIAPIAGRILDATPGVGGFQHLFILLAGISAAGLATVVWLTRMQRNKLREEPVT